MKKMYHVSCRITKFAEVPERLHLEQSTKVVHVVAPSVEDAIAAVRSMSVGEGAGRAWGYKEGKQVRVPVNVTDIRFESVTTHAPIDIFVHDS